MSHEFAKTHDIKSIQIPFPERLADRKIKEVRVLPNYDGTYFKIQYCYETTTKEPASNNGIMGIDIGVDNLASCITDNGTSFLMDGRKLKWVFKILGGFCKKKGVCKKKNKDFSLFTEILQELPE